MNIALRAFVASAFISSTILLTACDTAPPPPVEIPTGGPPAVPAPPPEQEAKGPLTSEKDFLALAKKSGCLVCHGIEKKVVGPAWKDVADRYIKALELIENGSIATVKVYLKNKVAKGGKGNWTEVTKGVPMPPYSPRVSDNNISRMVDYIMDELPKK